MGSSPGRHVRLARPGDRYQLLRDGQVVAEERKVRDPAVRHYTRAAIDDLHRTAGLDLPTYLAEFTREPARGDERIVTSVARRPA